MGSRADLRHDRTLYDRGSLRGRRSDRARRHGKPREELGELEGRAYKPVNPDESDESTSDRVKVEWVVKAKKGTKVKLTAKHDRAGVVKMEAVLK